MKWSNGLCIRWNAGGFVVNNGAVLSYKVRTLKMLFHRVDCLCHIR
jgi:hypothetical protein